MSPDPDSIYLQQVLAGDSAAYRLLVDRHRDMAFSIALQVVKSREEAEEVAMDAFVKCFQKLDTFKAESKFSTWLYRVVYNTAISRVRKKKLEISPIDESLIERYTEADVAETVSSIQQEERQRYLNLALGQLAPEDATLVQLFYLADHSIEEVAEITELTESNVKVKLHRARKKLYIYLERMLRHELKELL